MNRHKRGILYILFAIILALVLFNKLSEQKNVHPGIHLNTNK
jgi:hypothetical protein